jgi:LCP family protein required for cell wall assembly
VEAVNGDGRRIPERGRATPQQAPWSRRPDRDHRPVPQPRFPPPPRRPAAPVEQPTRPVPPRRPVRSREPEPPTRPVPRTARPQPHRPEHRRPETITPAPAPPRAPKPPAPRPPAAAPPAGAAAAAAPDGTAGRAARRRRARTLRRALLATAAATVAPGAGHLLLRRRRAGALILGAFVASLATLAVLLLTARRSDLLENLLSTRTLVVGALGCVLAALAWIAVIVRTYLLARPRELDAGRQTLGVVVVTALCLVVAAPLGFGANLANSQRNLLDALFPDGGGGTSVAEAIGKPRLNILLVGSDAGPDRAGARTDTMMVASVDTASGRTTLFGLPRNLGYAQFPPGSPMEAEFPNGFHDRSDPTSGDYLLNAVYAYGVQFPALAPSGPTADPGLNLLHQTVSHMLGLKLDYFVEVNMAGFASMIDAVDGLTVDVGEERIPIGGITPSGRQVEPDGYIEPGVQQLTGEQALAFARSRTGSTDYARMGRQRCLIKNILDQKSPTDLLANFKEVAAATTNSVSTNIPQQVLPALASLAGGEGGMQLESVSFDPDLPDPEETDGHFNTGRPNFPYMREVVQDAISGETAAPPPTAATPSATPSRRSPADGSSSAEPAPTTTAAPTSLAQSC